MAEKQKECERLENLFLQYKNDPAEKVVEEMEASFKECRVLEEQVHEASENIEIFGADKQFIELRKVIKEKEDALSAVRSSYRKMKGKILAVADVDAALNEQVDAFTVENERLKVSLQGMKDRSVQQEMEMHAVREELMHMEQRYLRQVEAKHN